MSAKDGLTRRMPQSMRIVLQELAWVNQTAIQIPANKYGAGRKGELSLTT